MKLILEFLRLKILNPDADLAIGKCPASGQPVILWGGVCLHEE